MFVSLSSRLERHGEERRRCVLHRYFSSDGGPTVALTRPTLDVYLGGEAKGMVPASTGGAKHVCHNKNETVPTVDGAGNKPSTLAIIWVVS